YKTDLKVRVGLKETEEPMPVCYCFGYTKKMIMNDFFKNDRSTIQEEITKKVKQGICRCEVTNPQGTCCLGNVAQVIKSVG
ncbi:MAG TPA: putative iron-sulfur cluster-binding metallochaperone, partial [Candidatus Wunengus californicus]